MSAVIGARDSTVYELNNTEAKTTQRLYVYCICVDAEHRGDTRETGVIFDLGQALLPSFAEGLADEWSPVRLAASVAVRRFLLALPNNNSRQAFYPLLLPRMCLNRYCKEHNTVGFTYYDIKITSTVLIKRNIFSDTTLQKVFEFILKKPGGKLLVVQAKN